MRSAGRPWEGDGLVGIARVLSDGHLTATLADLLDVMPRGSLSILAPRGTGGFFEKVGCERALAAFTLHTLSSNMSS